MADPLSQLRQFHINKREIKELNGYIIFGDHGWPKNVQTNYQIYAGGGSDNSKKEYYTLECLLRFLKHKEAQHTLYVRQAVSEHIPVVTRPDRKNLLAYLEGEAQTSASIDKTAPIPSVRLPLSEIEKLSQNSSHTSGSQQRGGDSNTGSSSGNQYQNDVPRGISDDFGTPTIGGQKRPHDPEAEKRYREEFAARLYEPSNKKLATVISTDSADKIGDSAEPSVAITTFGAEKLAAFKAKRTALKRTTIVDADVKTGSDGADTGGKEDYLITMDAEKFNLIKSKEKVWRTRSTILQSQSKDFLKSVLPMIELLTKSDNLNKKPAGIMPPVPTDLPLNPMFQQHPNAAQFAATQAIPGSQPSAQRNTYNRYDQERFVKLDIGVEIDTKKSFVSGVASSLTNINQPQAQQTASAAKPAQPTRINSTPSTPVLSNGNNNQRAPLDQVDHRQRQSTVATPTNHKPTKRASCVPIIIIPATTTSLINMYNATTILQDLTYADGKPGDRPRENEILIQRKKPDGTHVPYKVIDNPVKLDGVDWNRVVAVFVQGPAWQFKGWPWGGSPVEIFSRIKAFHLKWDEQKLDDNVAKWNVHILELSRNKRHLDKANLLKFWSTLDSFMTKYKNFLKF